MIYTDYLVHHGIKGQKWGIRRYQNPDGSLTGKGKRQLRKAVKNQLSGKNRIRSTPIGSLLYNSINSTREAKILSLFNEDYSGNYFFEKAYGNKNHDKYLKDWEEAYNNYVKSSENIYRRYLGDMSQETIDNGQTYLEYLLEYN